MNDSPEPSTRNDIPTLSDIRLFGDWGYPMRVFMSIFTIFVLANFGNDLMSLLYAHDHPEVEAQSPFGLGFEAHLTGLLVFLVVGSLSAKLTMESLFSPSGVQVYHPDSQTPITELNGMLSCWREYRFEVKAYLFGFPLAVILPLLVQVLTAS